MKQDVHEGETLAPRTLSSTEDHEVLVSRAMTKVLRYNSEGTSWYSSDRLVSIISVKGNETTVESVARTSRRNCEHRFAIRGTVPRPLVADIGGFLHWRGIQCQN